MAIVKMKRLRLLAMTEDREALLRTLQTMGCLELSEPTPGASSEGEDPERAEELLASLSPPDGRALSEAQTRRQEAERALGILKHYGAKGRGFLSPKPQTTQEALCRPQSEQEQNQAVAAVLEGERQVSALTAAARPFEEAVQAVQGASQLVSIQEAGSNRELRFCLLACHVSAWKAVSAALRDFGWSRVNLEGWTGTARENDARLAGEQKQAGEDRKAAQDRLAAMGDKLDLLYQAADRAAIDIRREEGRTLLRDTEQTFLLQGWVSEDRWPELKAALDRYPCAYEAEDPGEDDYPDVPVQLKNNWFTRPLNMVTEMYSLPAYGTVDPNPLMAPFFILFYGVMLADMGYGLLMILASLFVLKKVRPKGGMYNFFALMGLCGVSTLIMGAVTGGFFGDFLTQMTTVLGWEEPIVLPALFTPLNDTMMILIGAMCLGFVQIVTGMAVSVVRKVKAGAFLDAFWEEITWWIVFAGIALAVLGATPLVLYAALALVVAGPLVTGKGFGKITGIFGSLYNHITGYFGDILSYSRLMALMLAGSVIAQVFNTLGAIPGNIVIFLIISAAGNALNFALNLLGCYVHDLRLQCLEYFGKFYEDGGKPFRPLDLSAKYYDVIK